MLTDNLDDFFDDLSPLEIFELGESGTVCLVDTFFYRNSYGDIRSGDYLRGLVDFDTLIERIIEDDNDGCNGVIRQLLDEYHASCEQEEKAEHLKQAIADLLKNASDAIEDFSSKFLSGETDLSLTDFVLSRLSENK